MKVSLCIGITILILGMLIAVCSADPHYGSVVGTNPYSSGPDGCCNYPQPHYPSGDCCNYPSPLPLPDGHSSVCDDCNPCTVDSCTPNGCVHQPVNCDDGNPCTVDSCTPNGCVHQPVNCDDGNPCTVDSCTPNGCVHQPVIYDSGRHLGVDAWYGAFWYNDKAYTPKWPRP